MTLCRFCRRFPNQRPFRRGCDMKPRLTMSAVYDIVATSFRASGNMRPSACDVRCAVNDALDDVERDGCLVNHGYSQAAAFRRVRGMLGGAP